MKKFLCVLMAAMLLVGCTSKTEQDNVLYNKGYITGVWISYAELDNMLAGGDFKNQFDIAITNCKSRKITDVFVHTRPFCDAIYNSQYFVKRESTLQYDFDILEYMITKCHNASIRFHAWINPYRVRTADSDIQNIAADSIVRKWLEDNDQSNDNNVCFSQGIYLNPAASGVQQLIINGMREIIDGYKVDGIHFDDYFYPTKLEDFDSVSYLEYAQHTKQPLNLEDWRRANVNALISGAFTAIKFKNKDIIFSVSPSASIGENYNNHYADIINWCNSGCVDYIIPQLYFGFEYPDSNFRFQKLLADWQSALKNAPSELIIGLASYKIKTQNEPDKKEWANGTDVIKKQIELCKSSNDIKGHIYFSYSSMCEFL